MARPIKQGLDYFPFDVDFFNDEKIVAIAGEYGIKGEITTIKLLCAVYRNGYFIEWSEMLKFKLLKELPGVSTDLLENIIRRLVKWDFFDKNLFDTASILTSKGIQRRYQAICVKMHRKNCISSYSLLPSDATEPKAASSPKPQAKPKPAPEKTILREPPAPAPGSKIPLEASLKTLLADSNWRSEVCTHYHIAAEELPKQLEDFRQSCICLGKTHHVDMTDVKRHFCSWFNSHPKKSCPKPRVSSNDYTFSGGFGGKDT
ncbi:MAG: DUF4373 domain-containing protein [Bacteroides sp.]|nr:DUF4373 domain-containing protein [Bacteroides sp.]